GWHYNDDPGISPDLDPRKLKAIKKFTDDILPSLW
ncbi:unnamed protein product, partial [Allacma fusca]